MVLAVVLHAAGALVAWTVYLSVPDDRVAADRRPELPGQTTIVRLAGMPVFQQRTEPRIEPYKPPKTQIVVTPTETRIARRTFVATSTDVSNPSPSELALVQRLLETPPAHPMTRRGRTTSSETPVPETPDTKPVPRRQPTIVVPSPRVSVPGTAPQRQSVGRGVETLPELVDNRPPIYPAQAINSGQQGTVLLRVLVEASGAAGRVEIVRSSGHPVLDAEAVRTVRTWRFSPATRNAQPVPYAVRLPVRFTLE